MSFALIKPDLRRLPTFLDALRRGWSPDNVRGEEAVRELLTAADNDPGRPVA